MSHFECTCTIAREFAPIPGYFEHDDQVEPWLPRFGHRILMPLGASASLNNIFLLITPLSS